MKDIYGNFTYYSQDNIFTVGAPYLQSLTSTTVNGTYGPSSVINVTATYQDNLEPGSSTTVLLNTGVSVILNTIAGNKLSGSYAVGASGSGQNNPTLSVSSISSQYACNAANYCYSGKSLPTYNIANGSAIAIDTTAPVFSAVGPISGSSIRRITTASSIISYTLSESLSSGTIIMTRTSGSADASSPHTCTLTGTYLNWGIHSNFDTVNCQGGAVALVDGTWYTFAFSGHDASGNNASPATQTGIYFDTTAPVLQSFTSTTADGTYGAASAINVTANYSEGIASGGSMSVIMNTGAVVSLTRDISNGLKLTGVYTVGSTTSGQNTSDLAVSSIVSQNVWDGAGNYSTGTSLPGTNISTGSQIVVDTTIPSSGSTVFVTDPVNIANTSSVVLSVDGEIGTTIYYSIDDTSGATSPIAGNIAMEADGSTNITGLNLSSLVDGVITATVYLKKVNGEQSSSFQDTVTKDTARPTSWSTQYYGDSAMTQSLGDNPKLSAGTYYIRMGFGEALLSTPTVTIDAQGTANDVTADATTYVNASTYKYTRVITTDAAASGTVLEDILLVSATDVAGNTATNTNPASEALKAAYTDTTKPTVVGSITPSNAKIGAVSVSLVFNEAMKTTVAPTVILRKSNGTILAVSGSYLSATNWTGTATISAGDSNGVATLEVSLAQDVAGNVLDANSNVNTFTIDTINPNVSIVEGVDEGPVKTDIIAISASDTGGSGIASRFYGYSADAVCNASDTINNPFTSDVNFSITGNRTDYLCTKVTDNAGNINYLFVGKLNVDNTAPTITSVTSNVDNGSYKVGATIDIRVNFSENVTSSGSVAVTLETGTTDRACSFSVSGGTFGSCNYVVQEGDISPDLSTISIVGTIADIAGNALTNFTPGSSLAANKNIVIDTVTPVVNLIAPLGGAAVNSATVVLFSDTETTAPQCSFDTVSWTSCISGTTTLANIAGWDTLGEGTISLYLKDTDLAGNIATDVEVGIIRDTNMPVVANVTSDKNNGSYKVGELIHIIVTFSRAVTSTGSVIVTLETGNFDQACSFSISNALTGTCNYIVKDGDNSNDLNVNSVSGTIQDSVGNLLASTTPVINLADNKDIKIDTIKPTIASVTSDHADGTFLLNERINVQVNFSEPVTSSGSVTVNLDSGGSCSFTVVNLNRGVCDYYVGAGQNSLDLTTTSIVGSITDNAGNSLTNFAPVVNLGQSRNIKIDTTPEGPPTIVSVTSDKNDGAYTVGAAINLTANFSETVTSAGNVTITLETGAIDRSCTFVINSAISGTCTYVVQEGDVSGDLSVNSVSGIIRDVVNNALVNTTPNVNLDATKNIIIDTVAPGAPTITLLDPITDINKTAGTITGTGEANAVIQYSINDTNGTTSAKVGTGTVSSTGSINITGIDLTGLDGGVLTASVTLADAAGNVGASGTDSSTSQVILPVVTSVTSSKPDGAYALGETIDIRVNFSENVTSIGTVTVMLETGINDRSCAFSINNANNGTCDYIIQAGDASNDLNVKFISGNIADQADNPMVNFGLNPNLADSKNIIIDTTAPLAPSITLTDPITDANKSNVAITGTGEANMTIRYSIDDTNSATPAKTGTGTVLGNSSINVTGINVTGLDGGTITVTAFLTDAAGNIGSSATDTATSQVVLPKVSSVTSNKADGAYTVEEGIDIQMSFSENVTSDGDITLSLETGTTDRSCIFSVSNSNVGVCNYIVQAGDVTNDLNVNSMSGSIHDQAGNPMLDLSLYSNLAENKNIVIDTTNVTLISFGSTSPNNTYGPGSSIGIVASYSEGLRAGSSIELLLNTGATVTLNSITDTTKLTGTYIVGQTGSGEGTTDLSVASITAQNTCDLAANCLTTNDLPGTNIAANSQIAVDAVSPVFSEVFPDNSTNIESITTNSNISYTLSENLASGKIVINRTAWADDPNSPHTCTLSGAYLAAGKHENFNTDDCAFGGITLASGAIYSFSFNGKDAYGNEANEVLKTGVSYGLDVNAPAISSVRIDTITSSSAIVHWTTDENANSLVDFGLTTQYGNIRGNAFALETEHSVELDGLTPGTGYRIRVRSTDSTNNQGIDDNIGDGYRLTTLTLPAISNVQVTDITFSSARVSWETDIEAYSYVNYGETEAYGKAVGGESALASSQSVLLDGLKTNQIYHCQIKVRDIYGNDSFNNDFTFATAIDPTDRDAPVISSVVVTGIAKNTATINWTTNEPANSYVEYGTTDKYGEKYGRDTLIDLHSVALPAVLSPNTIYYFRVASSDANNNKSVSEGGTFITTNSDGSSGNGAGSQSGSASGTDGTSGKSVPDISLSNINASEITSSSSMISWKTSEACNGMVRYGTTTDYGQSSGEDLTLEAVTNFTSDHKVVLSNLLSNTTYHYMAVSYDSNGNIFISSDKTFDTSALSSVSGVSVSNITLNSARINWETADPVTSELEYGSTPKYGQIVKDAIITNSHKIELTKLATGETYHFRVKGANNNNAIASDDYIFATFPEPKVSNYEVKEVSDSGALVQWTTNIPTESSLDYKSVSDPSDKGLQGASDVTNNHEVKIIGLKQGTDYEIKVRGMDANKNIFESESFRVKTDIDLTPPVISHVSSKASLANQKDDVIQAIIYWKTDELANSQVLFDVGMGNEDMGQQSKEDKNLTTNHVVVLTDLRPGTVYRFRTVSKDSNQNVQKSDVFSLLTPRREKSVFQLILSNFEQTFGWMKKIKQ
ncbi:MAG: hypothetical protein WCG84_02300 [Candidatus Moraniibacteriota bacterium]